MYRHDPIPHTGSNKRIGPYMRRPSCIGMYREQIAYKEFHRKRFIPNSYDDLRATNILDKSWKRTKKENQWM